MSTRRKAGNQSLDDLVRLACSADPEEPVRRPRRLAIAPRAAVVAGTVLLVLAVVLALRTVLSAPGSTEGAAGATSTPVPVSPESPTPGLAGAGGSPGTVHPGASAGGQDGQGDVVVHVTGAVSRPGVVILKAGSRVTDAISAAGGAAPDADTEQLNLARVLSDGEQIRVPRLGEVLPDPAPAASATTGSGTVSGTGGDASGTVNINTASASELERLPGIGPALAQRIVDYRDSHGPFASVEALTDVPGIGKAKMEALREQATV